MSWLEGATIRPSGEAAFVIEYGEAIDQAVGRRVAALFAALEAAAPEGFVEAVPTFRSLLVLFDPDVTTRDAILEALPEEGAGAGTTSAEWIVPACFEATCAEDLDEAARGLDMPPDTVRERLAASRYQVGMYGFAPGYAYLSGIDQTLTLPRRQKPRPPIPAGSIIIAAGMAVLASVSMPTGWYVVGRTALTLFDKDADPMVPFAVGDRLTFEPVCAAELERLTRDGGGLKRADA
ncbi:allophanate hydrolase subunit 1 [Acuticoccus sp. I52.16.1]|uniref:5-oxoprolinase subunit B family protein n=1 Tax=Acuticoccus sp. I52.16.1 TaxID=2928472 RepID=UPI001FD31EDF|nr:carboxyltransferase domain-containing protein [Acuticoccus sp. I52.16.1]UOM35938.1 allophanate hydrolase subunit 1 [Acuticoccus sp. I52.16.1]